MHSQFETALRELLLVTLFIDGIPAIIVLVGIVLIAQV